jgi:hypothetical protein
MDVDVAFEDDGLLGAAEDEVALDIVELEVDLVLKELDLLVGDQVPP